MHTVTLSACAPYRTVSVHHLLLLCTVFLCSLLSNGVSAAARPTPAGFPFPNANVPIVFIHVDGKESSRARGSKMNEQVSCCLVGLARGQHTEPTADQAC